MSVSAVYFLDSKGRIVLFRDYRGDIPLSCIESFARAISNQSNPSSSSSSVPSSASHSNSSTSAAVVDDDDDYPDSSISQQTMYDISDASRPVFTVHGVTYCYVLHSNLYVLAVTKTNSNAMTVLTYLHRLIVVLETYFKALEEESLRDNFVIVYELLDEMMDFGHPQFTEPKVLQEYITQNAHALDKSEVRPPMTVTNAVSWRSEVSYKKNEVFLDAIERLDLTVSAAGIPVRSEIRGVLRMRCFLSGMPELKLGLNDKVLMESMGRSSSSSRGKAVEMEDIKFHQCVRLSRFDADRTISFIPPDDEFDLMTYRLSTRIKPLILVESSVEVHARSRIEVFVKARAQFKPRSSASGVEIVVPVPKEVDSPSFKVSLGSAKYVPEKDAFVWTIKTMAGGAELMCRAHFGLPSTSKEDTGAWANRRPPIGVKFEIPYFTVSGLQVRYLKIVEKSGYQALPWVRYITESGDYELRQS
jgi:AP-1 complex subunit mu